MNISLLIQKALEARTYSYSPYSHFQVGAALLTNDGHIFTGCNIENASYSPTNCAERTAFFKAISEGYTEFKAIAIVGGKEGDEITEYCSPCGVCRQVMMEFVSPKDFQIIVAIDENHFQIYTLEQLLPIGFGPNSL